MKKQIIEKPILFKPEMVAAILKNNKIVTRRVLKKQPPKCIDKMYIVTQYRACGESTGIGYPILDIKPVFWNGLYLWVKEAWSIVQYDNNSGYELTVMYKDKKTSPVIEIEDETQWEKLINREEKFLKKNGAEKYLWRSSIFMFRAFSRIILRVKNVRIERLQELDNTEAVLEGCKDRADYARLWDEINKTPGYTWKDNPWVYRIQFEKVLNAGNAG